MVATSIIRVCSRCVLDESIPSIRFDSEGVCQFCKSHDALMREYDVTDAVRRARLDALFEKIRRNGHGKKYDCIVGVSGGTDSSYALYLAKKEGLRCLAVHFDDGWNSDIAVTNIQQVTTGLGVDLETFVVDWEEIKSLHRAFFLAGVPDSAVPTDVGIHGALYRVAIREKVKYILGGQSFVTEGTQPREWSYIDGTYVNHLHHLLGDVPLRTFPNATIYQIAYYLFVKGVRQIPFLNYYQYSKEDAKKVLEKELGWRDYGGHHYESVYSHFVYAYYDFTKFNIDKRKVTLSASVRMGKCDRQAALDTLQHAPVISQELVDYCIGKLGFSKDEFDALMKKDKKSFLNYHTSYPVLKRFGFILKVAVNLRLVTPVLYQKYLG